ncbi:MAG: SurA N-terminal domain-containing protein [Candidatus Krumholzibacteria bacterium]|nr:SurA N-terminal domain-containing protein [Candidatus Krumholzibacteria bacterium]
MFKFLRSQAKVFYWVIAASFVLFLGLGGMTSRGCQAPGTKKVQAGVIGSVNGADITGQQYDYAVRQQRGQMRQQAQNRDLNANQDAAASQQAWDSLVQAAIFQQAIEKRGITVSDEEVLSVFENNPPPELLAQYRDENGNVDMDRYFADLQNPAVDWTQQEAYIRASLPWQKLIEEISAEAVVTDEDVHQEYIRQTGKAIAEYMGITFADMEGEFEASETELEEWYQAHPDDYQSPAKGHCQVVMIAKEASEQDYEEIREFMLEIREEIVSGQTEFGVAALEYSEDATSATQSGDLGVFDRSRMVAPFTEAAFALQIGEVSQPVKTKFGYHLIEVLKQSIDEDTGEVYEINARHILLKVTPGPETLDLLRERADEFRSRVDGSSFATTAEAEALNLITPPEFIKGRDIPGVPLSLAGSNWVFGASPGQVSRLFENRDNIYVVLAGEITPAGLAPLSEVTSRVALAVKKDHQLAAAKTRLSPAVGEVQMGMTMAEGAGNAGILHAVTDTFTINGNVPDVGYGTEFNKLAINGELGVLVPEVETLRGLFALTPLWISPFDQADFDVRRAGIQAALLARAQNKAVEEWYIKSLEEAEIVDLRYWQP